MIAVPAGRVTLSDRRTRRTWHVDVGAFEIAATPLTHGEYAGVVGEGPDATRGSRLPVDEVSWRDAIAFCNTLSERAGLSAAYRMVEDDVAWDTTADGYRLPTEAEWEHACRAGTTGPRYGPLDAIAWYHDNSGGQPHDVGGKQPNAWGLHDTLGNVWEWCWDLYDPEVYGTYRVLRGGGWFDEHWSCRASVRRRSHPTYRIDDVGFRIARVDRPLPNT
ncbi:MAG: SUMF1/EgtB/PvdO family nonheme iron enzyme [Rhodococcus sp. (in: high G+C Gram-positive bacteria)]|uniref:formylglycine-generating enzyme family protein n=1 Tax=Rhodococcus sp. TaxID=1831 RepID=UPI003BB0EC66